MTDGETSWSDVVAVLHRSTRPARMAVPCGRGVGILTFRLGVDGVSHVVAQYVAALRGRSQRHLADYYRIVTITGPGQPPGQLDVGDEHVELEGFGLSNPVAAALHSALLPAGQAGLPGRVLAESERLATQLGRVLDRNRIGQLIVVNVNSLPHNVCAAIATVLAAERRSLRVLNICHNGYWEHEQGARAAILANHDNDELFDVIRTVSPWRSGRWHNAAPNEAAARRVPVAPDEGVVRVVSNAAAEQFLQLATPGPERAAVAELERRLPATAARTFSWTHGTRIVHPRHPVPGPGEPFVVLLPVRITQGKRIDRALAVVHRLLADGPTQDALLARGRRVIVVCAGPPDERGRAHNLLAGLTDAIATVYDDPRIPLPLRETFSVLLPFGMPSALAVGEPMTMAALYHDADIVLMTSDRESHGLPILEAAASGTPLLCVPYEAGHREIFDEVVAGLVVGRLPTDPSAGGWLPAARRWLLDPDQRASAIEQNRRVAAGSFGSSRLAEDLDNALGAAFWEAECSHRPGLLGPAPGYPTQEIMRAWIGGVDVWPARMATMYHGWARCREQGQLNQLHERLEARLPPKRAIALRRARWRRVARIVRSYRINQ